MRCVPPIEARSFGTAGSGFFATSEEKVSEQWNGARCGAFLFARTPRSTRDIEMRPLVFRCESRQKTCCSHATGRTTADIGEIREVALQLILIIVPKRHAPGAVISYVRRAQQLVGEPIVICKKPRRHMSQCNHTGARERCDVNDSGWLI